MNHLERLVRRALAVPRDQASALFDPFALTAPWEPDPPVPTPAATAVAPPRAPEPSAPAAEPGSEATARPAPTIAAPAATPAAPRGHDAFDKPAAAEVAAPPPAGRPAHPTPAGARPRQDPGSDGPLARADAFMQTLKTPRFAAESTGLRAAPPPSNAAPESRIAPPAPRVHEAAAPPRPMVRPPAVSAAPLAKPQVQAQARDTAQPPARRPAEPPRRTPLPPPAQVERIIEKTVVVAPSARRLDDLAHSSHIARFGLGQG